MWHCYGLLLAQIWQTGAVRPSAIIPRCMWARSSCHMCQMWAGSGLTICCYLGSPISQNEFIQSFAEEVTEEIRKEIKLSGMYAVMADEARDGKTEQLAVCVRYVNSDGKVVEHFLGLQELKVFDAKTIINTIEALLDANDLGNLTCVAQTYDGA
ncbi:hypothetical protein M9458_050867, partial [Cirrhinus mrigala]